MMEKSHLPSSWVYAAVRARCLSAGAWTPTGLGKDLSLGHIRASCQGSGTYPPRDWAPALVGLADLEGHFPKFFPFELLENLG